MAVHCLAENAGERGSLLREDLPFFWRTRIVLNVHLIGSTAAVSAGSARIFFPNLTNCEQTALRILDILPLILVAPLRPKEMIS